MPMLLGTLRILEGIRILGLEKKSCNFTKPLPQNYTVEFQISYKTKKLKLFIHVAPMESQNFIPIG